MDKEALFVASLSAWCRVLCRWKLEPVLENTHEATGIIPSGLLREGILGGVNESRWECSVASDVRVYMYIRASSCMSKSVVQGE
jgi:hypothetical protein